MPLNGGENEAVADKITFTKTLDSYQAKKNLFRTLTVPPMSYLMIDGQGDPNTSPAFDEALAALYPVAYALKFASKKELERDYTVPPLEALWWADDMSTFVCRQKGEWRWTLMIMVPEWISLGMVHAAMDKAAAKSAPARLDDVRCEGIVEGLSVQTLHVGSYDDEGPILERMHSEFIPENNLAMTGKHHEIYLSDPRRVAPEKLRTILRQPVRPVQG